MIYPLESEIRAFIARQVLEAIMDLKRPEDRRDAERFLRSEKCHDWMEFLELGHCDPLRDAKPEMLGRSLFLNARMGALGDKEIRRQLEDAGLLDPMAGRL
jgi:hypothetical protein